MRRRGFLGGPPLKSPLRLQFFFFRARHRQRHFSPSPNFSGRMPSTILTHSFVLFFPFGGTSPPPPVDGNNFFLFFLILPFFSMGKTWVPLPMRSAPRRIFLPLLPFRTGVFPGNLPSDSILAFVPLFPSPFMPHDRLFIDRKRIPLLFPPSIWLNVFSNSAFPPVLDFFLPIPNFPFSWYLDPFQEIFGIYLCGALTHSFSLPTSFFPRKSPHLGPRLLFSCYSFVI